MNKHGMLLPPLGINMVLPLVTIILIIISGFAWQAIYNSVLNYKITAATQQSTQQFFLAEHALLQAEKWLANTAIHQLPTPSENCQQTPCLLLAQAANYYPQQPPSWWQSENNFALTSHQLPLPYDQQAFYIIEYLQDATTLQSQFYRITAWALVHENQVPTILQSIWKKNVLAGVPDKRMAWRQMI